MTRAHLTSAAAAFIVVASILAWFAAPYLRLHAGGAIEAAGNSADLVAYLLPPLNTWLGQVIATQTALSPRWIWG